MLQEHKRHHWLKLFLVDVVAYWVEKAYLVTATGLDSLSFPINHVIKLNETRDQKSQRIRNADRETRKQVDFEPFSLSRIWAKFSLHLLRPKRPPKAYIFCSFSYSWLKSMLVTGVWEMWKPFSAYVWPQGSNQPSKKKHWREGQTLSVLQTP